MDAKTIQKRLLWENRQNFALPNFTPRKWFEADLFVLHPTSYWTEYEVKLTRSDYHADKLKTSRRWVTWNPETGDVFDETNKHEALNAKDRRGPNRFFFVAPDGVLETVPDWAGWVVVHETRSHHPIFRVRYEIVKPAPRLHKMKIDPEAEQHARSIVYYRWRDLYLKDKS